jgi:c-di-GMP-binding flagellar brake protein YcgR
VAYFPQPNPASRATRVKVPGSVTVAVHSAISQTTRATLSDVSTTGGLLVLSKTLEQGDFVEVEFETSHGIVRGMAELLPTRNKSESGCLQPLRFVALEDEDHTRLRMMLDLLLQKIPRA